MSNKALPQAFHRRFQASTLTSGAEFYPAKLKVRYVEENIVEYYPTVRFWVNDGAISDTVSFDRVSNSKIAQMFRMTLQKMSNNGFELEKQTINEKQVIVVSDATKAAFEKFSKATSDLDMINYLIGKKVKIVTAKGVYQKRPWFRNDWHEIL